MTDDTTSAVREALHNALEAARTGETCDHNASHIRHFCRIASDYIERAQYLVGQLTTPPEADAELARKDERIAALEACLRERDGGDHDPHCRIWTSGWQKKADKFCTCGHIEARALLERKP